MATTTDLEKLVINYLTQDQYDDAREAGTLNANELYLTPDTGSTDGTVTSVATGGGLTGGPITSSGTISHDDTSSQSSVSNSGRTYIQSVTLDTYGHVTSLSSATETVTDTHHQAYLYDTTSNGTTRVTTDTSDPYLTLVENSTARSRVQLKASTGISISANNGVVTFTNTSTNTDEKLKWTASTSSNTYYPLQSTSTATTSTANTLNGISFYQYYNTAGGYRRLDLGNSTAYKSTGGAYGTIRLYGAAATYYGDLVPGVLGTTSGDGHISANRTWTLPDKTGTIALTSDLPTIPTNVSAFTNDAGYLTSYTETDPTVPSWAKAASKPTYTASEVGALASNTTYVSTVTTTAGTHTAISSKSGAVSFNVPTKTSHLTNDSGFITSDSDEKVKSTPATAATTYYLIASTSSSENTATTSKHASIAAYTTADSGTSGYAELRLGNTTATSSAGGKEGTIRLYGTNATYYTTLKAGAVASSNKTITFPNATGTVALTSDLSNFVTSSGVTSIATTSPISGGTITGTGTISHATSGVGNAVTTAGFYKFKYDTYGHVTGVTAVAASDITGLVTIPTNTDEKVKSTTVTAATTYYLIGSTSSTTETATTSKHGSVSISVGADSNTSGGSRITLGNSTAEGTAGAKYGYVRLYGTNTRYIDLRGGAPSANITITLPNATGTVALTSDIPTALPVVTATGASTSTTISLANNTITQVPLTKTLINKAGVGNATISLETAYNTIVIEGIGIYRVTASVYIKPASSVWCNVFIKQGNDNASFASATEKGSVAAYLSNSGGAINITQTIQTTNNTSCYIYLAARVAGTTGTVYTGNAATYLEVEQIG